MSHEPPPAVLALLEGATVRLVLRGELDAAVLPELERAVAAARQPGLRLLVLDLRELTFIDSSALHAFVGIELEARREGHDLLVVRAPAQAQRIFSAAGLGERFVFVDHPDELPYRPPPT